MEKSNLSKYFYRDIVCSILFFCIAALGLTSVSQAYSSDQMLRSAMEKGPRAQAVAQQIQELIPRLAGQSEDKIQEVINTYYNSGIAYTTDMALYNSIDYWASPFETAARGRGDCEDYAIAKYFTLISAGIPINKLRMVYVKAELPSGSEGHMVLAYYESIDGEPVIMDNLTNDILPASRRTDLKPIFSFNSEGLWNSITKQSAGDPMVRISKWRDTVLKTKIEGF